MKILKKFVFFVICLILVLLTVSGIRGLMLKKNLCEQPNACVNVNSDSWYNLIEKKDSKIKEFVNDNSSKKYITLSNEEFTALIVSSLEKSSGGTLTVDWVYWEKRSEKNTFVLNLHLKLGLIPIGLYRIVLEKDDTQTVYVYITEASLNGIDLQLLGFSNLLNSINYNIKESIVFINSESSAPFVFDNIEFLDESVVLKGHYTKDYY